MNTKFDGLIELMEPLKKDEYGIWIADTEYKVTEDDPIHFPYPCYTEVVDELISQVYAFSEGNPDYELTKYGELLEERGLEWGSNSLENADVSSMDAQGIMAMLMGIVRGERFCDGAVLSACKSGSIVRWLERLKELSDEYK